MVISGI